MAKINVRDRNKNNPDKKPNWEYRFEAAKIDGKRKRPLTVFLLHYIFDILKIFSCVSHVMTIYFSDITAIFQ